jgi:hypothetical protein
MGKLSRQAQAKQANPASAVTPGLSRVFHLARGARSGIAKGLAMTRT